MFGHVSIVALLISTSVAEFSELSCSSGFCYDNSGVAMLQSSTQNYKKDLKVTVSSHVPKDSEECVSFAGVVPSDETGYNQVKEECCFSAMSIFIAQVAEAKGYKICSYGFGAGLAVWHGCEGIGASQTFADLTSAIDKHASAKCSSLSSTNDCPDLPADCPDFANVPSPPDCSCSQSNSVDINFGQAVVSQNNLGGIGPNSGAEELRYSKIGNIGGAEFDLVLKVTGGEPYAASNPAQKNGKWKNLFGCFQIKGYIKIDVSFTFVATGTDTPFELSDFVFSFMDFDGSSTYETAEADETECAGYVLEDDTKMTVSKSGDGKRNIFVNGDKPTGDDIPGPYLDPMDLTPLQRKASVMLFFKKVSSFHMSFSRSGAGIPGGDNMILFTGKCSMIDKCEP